MPPHTQPPQRRASSRRRRRRINTNSPGIGIHPTRAIILPNRIDPLDLLRHIRNRPQPHRAPRHDDQPRRTVAVAVHSRVQVGDEKQVRCAVVPHADVDAVVVVCGVARVGVDEEGLDGLGDAGVQTLCYVVKGGGVGGILEGHGTWKDR